MAIEKSLSIRDYLEPRFAAGASYKRAAKASASFQQLLKNEQLNPADSAAAGKRISDYVRTPVLSAHAQQH